MADTSIRSQWDAYWSALCKCNHKRSQHRSELEAATLRALGEHGGVCDHLYDSGVPCPCRGFTPKEQPMPEESLYDLDEMCECGHSRSWHTVDQMRCIKVHSCNCTGFRPALKPDPPALRPCPWCGETPQVEDTPCRVHVRCRGACKANAFVIHTDRSAAVAAWNDMKGVPMSPFGSWHDAFERGRKQQKQLQEAARRKGFAEGIEYMRDGKDEIEEARREGIEEGRRRERERGVTHGPALPSRMYSMGIEEGRRRQCEELRQEMNMKRTTRDETGGDPLVRKAEEYGKARKREEEFAEEVREKIRKILEASGQEVIWSLPYSIHKDGKVWKQDENWIDNQRLFQIHKKLLKRLDRALSRKLPRNDFVKPERRRAMREILWGIGKGVLFAAPFVIWMRWDAIHAWLTTVPLRWLGVFM